MKRANWIGSVFALLLLAAGALRFLRAALLPALQRLTGDFQAVFPTSYLAWLRPDFVTKDVWPGWGYGPLTHVVTLPLFLAPRWSMVPALWAMANVVFVVASFVLICRLSGVPAFAKATAGKHQISYTALAVLVALWLWFRPLQMCFEAGNIELLEMTLTLWGLVALTNARARRSGILLGLATMLKFLPIGFVGWLVVRREWRAVRAAVVVIGLFAVLAMVTAGWRNNSMFLVTLWKGGVPQVSADTQSVTSIFLHRAGLLDYTDPFYALNWFPTARARTAAQAGQITSVLLAGVFGVLLLLRRRDPVSPFEISVLFLAMFLIVPWNHQYYYVFGLVPVSVLFLRSVARRQWGVLAVTIAGYLMMSPPFFAWMDRSGWFHVPFFYVVNYRSLPVFGGLILWGAVTYAWFSEPAVGADDEGPVPVKRRVAVMAVPAMALALAAVGLWTVGARGASGASNSVATLEHQALLLGPPAIAVSPDGTRVAYVGTERTLCTKSLAPGAGAETCWPDANNAAAPFFSPDGRWIGFFSGGALRKAPAAGGGLDDVNGAPRGSTGHWGRDGTIVFSTWTGIWRIAAGGGTAYLLIQQRPEDGPYVTPLITPSGDAVIFTIAPPGGGLGAGTIVAQSLETGQRKTLLAGSQPHLDEKTGHLVYALGGQVLAVPFDVAKFEVSGVAQPLVADALTTVDGGTQFAISAEGTLVYLPRISKPVLTRALMWVDRLGVETQLPIPENAFEAPRLSPDGKTLAVAIRDVFTDVWTYDLAARTSMRVTSGANRNENAVWLPDGRTIAFAAAGGLAPFPRVLSARLDALDRQPAVLWQPRPPDTQQVVQLTAASPDGHVLAGTRGGDLWLLDTTAANPRQIAIHSPFEEQNPAFSPDGRWIAYTSNRTGRTEVYVQDFPGLRELHQVSAAGGTEPVWSRDGRELFYRGDLPGIGNLLLVSVPVTTSGSFTAGSPKGLFGDSHMVNVESGTSYDVAPDGQHFVMIKGAPMSSGKDVRVVRGWRAMLGR